MILEELVPTGGRFKSKLKIRCPYALSFKLGHIHTRVKGPH